MHVLVHWKMTEPFKIRIANTPKPLHDVEILELSDSPSSTGLDCFSSRFSGTAVLFFALSVSIYELLGCADFQQWISLAHIHSIKRMDFLVVHDMPEVPTRNHVRAMIALADSGKTNSFIRLLL